MWKANDLSALFKIEKQNVKRIKEAVIEELKRWIIVEHDPARLLNGWITNDLHDALRNRIDELEGEMNE